MTKVKLSYRASSVQGKQGMLYFVITKGQVTRKVSLGIKLYSFEWKEVNECVSAHSFRVHISDDISCRLQVQLQLLESIIDSLNVTNLEDYTVKDVVAGFRNYQEGKPSVFHYLYYRIKILRKMGRVATSDNCLSLFRSFVSFRNGKDLPINHLNARIVEEYEAFLKRRGNSRNTTSFYMRSFHSIYQKAVEEGFVNEQNLFKHVYKGVDKTIKRAISEMELKSISRLDLTDNPRLGVARDLFMFSFFTRGMSFVDLAYLRKKDLHDGVIVYRRSKTLQQVCIKWEKSMQIIIDRYPNKAQYLLPIITKEDGTERRQYRNALMRINHHLKKVGKLANLKQPLSMYTARHSWATIAHNMNVPLSVISEGLGHDNDKNTQIYLASIQTSRVDRVNHKIISRLLE